MKERSVRFEYDDPAVELLTEKVSVRNLSHLSSRSPMEPKSEVNDVSDNAILLDVDLSYGWETSWILTVWNTCLAITALLDFSAAIADNFASETDSKNAPPRTNTGESFFLEEELKSFQSWLLLNANMFAFLFAASWFFDAFLTAHKRRMDALREIDRQRLLHASNAKLGQTTSIDNSSNISWWKSAHGVYYRTMAFQILLLPVGFFIFCYCWVNELSEDDGKIEIVFHSDDDEVDDDYEVFTQHANISLGFALSKHALIVLSRFLGVSFRQIVPRMVRRLVRKLVIRFLRNPFRFSRRTRRVLRTARWIKYLAPMIGASNKLRENVDDLLKKFRQHREAVYARRIREQLWDNLSEEELREYCAILIQKTFRAHQSRKRVVALKLLLGRQESVAACRLQHAFRSSLRRARRRLELKKEELKLLEEKEKEKRNDMKRMDEKERRRMYMLQKELNDEAKELINERLLLRPNTSFAVAWKILFVIAVVFEIAQLAIKPVLAKYKDKDGNPMEVDVFLEQSLVPTPVFLLPECCPHENRDGLFGFVRNIVAREPAAPKEFPWYCQSQAYSFALSVYIPFTSFWIHSFLDIVGFICFLDVFITFFTGDYDATGSLVPKPFMKRWILPGLALQLLVNPTMETISDIVFRAFEGLIRRGPFRVLRWTLALFFPCGKLLIGLVKRLWLDLVRRQNQQAGKLVL